MLDPELLEILVCPETKTRVQLADAALLERVNRAIAGSRLTNRAGQKVVETIDGGLVREDGRLLYPIRDGIPVMLIDEALPLDGLG
ncbi:MAG: Trm112 family protein [Gemmatimonadetes bacterium]|nr:Trm112 family protein [Gemmatimonadota bacterium]